MGSRLKGPQVSDPVCEQVSTGWESRVEATERRELNRGQSGIDADGCSRWASDSHPRLRLRLRPAWDLSLAPMLRLFFHRSPAPVFSGPALPTAHPRRLRCCFILWPCVSVLVASLLASPPGLFQLRLRIPPLPESITSKPV